MGRGRRCNKPPIQHGPNDMRWAETLILQAISSPALDPPFAACNTPGQTTMLRAMHVAHHDCTQQTAYPDRHRNRISGLHPKSPRSDPCSRFLPYVSVWMGFPAQAGSQPRVCRCSHAGVPHTCDSGTPPTLYRRRRHCWRSRSYAARAAKREVRVGASGRLASQAAIRSRLMAAAVAKVCSPVLARPR